jgi:nitrogen regulatory protein PII
MNELKTPAHMKLLIVTGPFELSEHLAKDFKEIGAQGFTTMRVDGYGAHGTRKYSVVDGANVRFEIVASPAFARRLLHHLETAFEGQAVVGYVLDCEAVPAEHFR